jgi:hypothetical protein
MAANKGASPEAVWLGAREIVKDVDNRFDELEHDTLFWRKSVSLRDRLPSVAGTRRGTRSHAVRPGGSRHAPRVSRMAPVTRH